MKKLIYFGGPVDLLYDSKGNKVGFYGLVRDITERKIAEHKLKESEEKYYQLFETGKLMDGNMNTINKRLQTTDRYLKGDSWNIIEEGFDPSRGRISELSGTMAIWMISEHPGHRPVVSRSIDASRLPLSATSPE